MVVFYHKMDVFLKHWQGIKNGFFLQILVKSGVFLVGLGLREVVSVAHETATLHSTSFHFVRGDRGGMSLRGATKERRGNLATTRNSIPLSLRGVKRRSSLYCF